MATTPDRSGEQAAPQWLQALSQYRKESAYVLFGVSAVAAIGLALLAWKDHQGNVWYWAWCGLVAAITLGAGLWQMLHEPGRLAETDMTRLVVLAVGGLIGLATTLVLGLGLTVKWWDTISGGWDAWRGDNGTRVWWTLLAFVGGLALMFISLQLARADERANPLLRRLLYGFNAVLSALLLLAVLVFLNVLTYVPWQDFGKSSYAVLRPLKYLAIVNTQHDWSRASIYSLSDKSENILREIDKPVKIYAVISTDDQFYHPVRALLDNVRAVNNQIEVEYLAPALNQKRVGELASQYKFNEEGLLVVVGSGSKTESQLVKRLDLIEASSAGRGRQSNFNGEIALISVINHLAHEGQTKPVLYFTQGNGELSIFDQRGGFDTRTRDGAGLLAERLESRGFYKVKGLQFSQEAKEKPDPASNRVVSNRVPEDAAAVVALGPRRPLPEFALKALRDYMGLDDPKQEKRGRLMLMLGFAPDQQGEGFAQTGLERLAAEFNVQVGKDVILRMPRSGEPEDAAAVVLVTPPEGPAMGDPNPVSEAFKGQGFVMLLPLTVQSMPGRPGAGRYTADVLLEAPDNQRIWTATSMDELALPRIRRMVSTGEADKRASPRPLPVAVAVSEADSMMPMDDVHAGLRRRGSQPRAVVMGNAIIFTNQPRGNSPERPYDLFNSSLAWLRGRPADIGIDPKRSDVFEWGDPKKINVTRMIFLPGIVAAIMIVGLGAGVWIVRRR